MRRLLATTVIVATGALAAAGLTVPANAVPAHAAGGSSEQMLLVDTSIGGHAHPIVGATVELVNPAGKVEASGVTNANGAESLRHRALPPAFSIRISGGTIDGQPNGTVLEAAGSAGSQSRVANVIVDPITTIAMRLGRLRGGSPEHNLQMVREALGFPDWLSEAQIANGTGVIDREALQSFIDEHGGLHEGLTLLASEIAAGHAVPKLFGLTFTSTLPQAGPPTPTDGSSPSDTDTPGNSHGNGQGKANGNANVNGQANTPGAADTGPGNGKGNANGWTKASGPIAGLPGGKQTREATSSNAVGLYLFGCVVSGVSSSAGTAVIGSLFGTSAPTQAELTDIDNQLKQINDDLIVLQGDMQAMIQLQNVSIQQTIAYSMATIIQNTSNDWTSYQTFVETADPTASDYQQSVEDMAEQFEQDLSSYISEFNDLFSVPATGTIGYLQQMYSMESSAIAWYTETDLKQIQGAVDYYGTLQAEAVTLLTEAWQTPNSATYTGGKTPTFVQTQLSTLGTQNSNIYLSWPDDITDNEVVVPTSQVAYSLAPYTMPNESDKWVTYTSNPTGHATMIVTSCTQGAYNEGSKHLSSPTSVSGATETSQFATAVPAGYTQADTTDFSVLSQPRGGQYTTGLLKPSGSSMEVLVTLNSSNGVSQQYGSQDQKDKYETYTWHFAGWLWCHDHTLDITTANQWKINPYFSGSVASPSHQFQTGVLVTRPGTWTYVQPPAS